MKQLLVVNEPECVEPAKTLVGEVCEVVAYSPRLKTKDRKIVYWPTAPGTNATMRAKKMAKDAEEVKVLVTQGQPEGWNAMTAVADGWDIKQFLEWAKPRSVVVMNEIHIHTAEDEIPAPTKSQIEKLEENGLAQTGGKPIADISNINLFLERDKCGDHIWYDTFHHKIFHDMDEIPTPWSDHDTLKLTAKLQAEYGFRRIGDETVFKGVQLYAMNNPRSEPRDWIRKIKWDGVSRISNFLHECLGAESTAYMSAASHNFWVGLIARIFEPGCQNDSMMVLEGSQGARKTSALRMIGGPWYAEIRGDMTSTKFLLSLHGRVLLEISELDAFNKTEVTTIKQVISCPVDSFVPPYGRVVQKFPRTCVFVGTTNKDYYLRDETGGRRFWPVKCGDINLEKIKTLRPQLFAEAFELFMRKEPWWIMPDSETKEVQEDRRHRSAWEEKLEESLLITNFITLKDVMLSLGFDESRIEHRHEEKVISILRKIGFERRSKWIDGSLKRGWARKDDFTPENQQVSLLLSQSHPSPAPAPEMTVVQAESVPSEPLSQQPEIDPPSLDQSDQTSQDINQNGAEEPSSTEDPPDTF